MKRFKQSMLGCGMALFIVLSANVTNACLGSLGATDSSGSWAYCELYGGGDNACYYECICVGDCTSIYQWLGLKKIHPAI